MKKKSKRYKELTKLSTKNKKVELKDLIELVKKTSTTKFDESIDVSLRINLKQTKGGDFNLRTVFKLPEGSGKKSRVAVLCEADKVEDAKKSGAEVYGSDDLIEKIAVGKFDFDKLICTPAMMGKLGKHGKVLGPKGLMPNPKSGTVTTDISSAVKDLKAGKVEIRVEKTGIVHIQCGKSSFEESALMENIKTIYETIMKAKPASLKGTYFKKISVSSTMGPGIRVNQGTIG